MNLADRLQRKVALAFLLFLAWVYPAHSHEWPDHEVQVIVPFSGAATDAMARIISQQVAQDTGQAFVVLNRPGASGAIGSASVARAAADGYTLLFTTSSTHAVAPHVSGHLLPYDVTTDFTPIAHMLDGPMALVATSGLAVDNVEQLIALVWQRPGQLSYSSTGTGAFVHITGEMFKQQAGIDVVHVPYSNGTWMHNLIAGEIHFTFTSLPSVLPHIQAGRLRGLAMTSPTRSPLAPQMPAIAETLPGFDAVPWYGLFGPANMPGDVVERINTAFNKALTDPTLVQRLVELGVEPGGQQTPAEFAAFVADDRKRWGERIRALGNIQQE